MIELSIFIFATSALIGVVLFLACATGHRLRRSTPPLPPMPPADAARYRAILAACDPEDRDAIIVAAWARFEQ